MLLSRIYFNTGPTWWTTHFRIRFISTENKPVLMMIMVWRHVNSCHSSILGHGTIRPLHHQAVGHTNGSSTVANPSVTLQLSVAVEVQCNHQNRSCSLPTTHPPQWRSCAAPAGNAHWPPLLRSWCTQRHTLGSSPWSRLRTEILAWTGKILRMILITLAIGMNLSCSLTVHSSSPPLAVLLGLLNTDSCMLPAAIKNLAGKPKNKQEVYKTWRCKKKQRTTSENVLALPGSEGLVLLRENLP